ncbi:transaldolase [Blastococcus sp. TF02A-35]|uniref:transaldolase n=1 Tax=Blastococcus sp. TF02A-35 TaxID=2559612 RepID=UPI001ADDBBF4|nr:transaldolase [Blastococcus sp. TF02A_35]
MSNSDGEPSGNVIRGPDSWDRGHEARAYSGPAHGQQWQVIDPEPPAWVELPVGAASALYRLVRQPRSHRPARDQLGNYLYVPMTDAPHEPMDGRTPDSSSPPSSIGIDPPTRIRRDRHAADGEDDEESHVSTSLQRLAETGQSAWIDHLSRRFLKDGGLASLLDRGVTGLTSNLTTFRTAIVEGDAYDEQLRDALAAETDPKEVFLALAIDDIRAACDALAGVHTRSDQTRDGWVSTRVDPHLAHDTEATVAEAVRLHRLIDRPNLLIEIPGTDEGVAAIEETIAAGIPVNVSMLFSLDRHRAAAHAYIRGLRKLQSAGGDLQSVASVASFSVSRIDTEADRWLDDLGSHEHLKGTLAIATAKLAYQTYLLMFTGAVWDDLAAAGASPQRCLWASTEAKNSAYRDVRYLENLVGPQTVTCLPRDTAEAFLDHGTVAETLTADVDGARRTLEAFTEAGVDYDDLTAVLEQEGVEEFVASFGELMAGIAAKRDELIRD